MEGGEFGAPVTPGGRTTRAAVAPRPPASVRPGVAHLALAVGGFAIGAYALGVVVGAPVLTVVAARVARRTLLIALMGLIALGNGLSAVALALFPLAAGNVWTVTLDVLAIGFGALGTVRKTQLMDVAGPVTMAPEEVGA